MKSQKFLEGEVSPYARTALRSTLSSGVGSDGGSRKNSRGEFLASLEAAVLRTHPRNAPDLISRYHKILSPDFPDFLRKYCELPLVQRLRGVGLLCGTDWTPLYRNRFFYSRYDHSVGTALITWHFTHDKAQALASLLHDVSTPAFSHVSDFRKGDALTQSATENANAAMIRADEKLRALLAEDGIALESVCDYHVYPICDNEIPRLSADRLEYMFPSGMALHAGWTLSEIAEVYGDIAVLKNEDGTDELGFRTASLAEKYCERFCGTANLLQKNENKLALQLLAEIVENAIAAGIITESDLFEKSEAEIISLFDDASAGVSASAARLRRAACGNISTCECPTSETFPSSESHSRFAALFHTFRNMTHIEHTDALLSADKYFCVSLKVKQRYIDPLVANASTSMEASTSAARLRRAACEKIPSSATDNATRLSAFSPRAAKIIADFKSWNDTAYGCVQLQKI